MTQPVEDGNTWRRLRVPSTNFLRVRQPVPVESAPMFVISKRQASASLSWKREKSDWRICSRSREGVQVARQMPGSEEVLPGNNT